MKVVALIAAAGLGKRMNSKISKSFIPIFGKPILAYTLEKFEQCKLIEKICLIVNQEEKEFCSKNIILKYNFSKVQKIIDGGETRQDSVYNGLKALSPDVDIVVIHDGARPLVEETLIQDSIEAAQKNGAVIVAIPLKDTVKKSQKNFFIKETLNREEIWRAQTPQTFKYDMILSAYHQAYKDKFCATDDAAIVERYGHKVKMIIGSEENIKITTPFDIIIAENFLKRGFKFTP
ncbi:MAG: 2-C-methyl-D-erythritol 4-phosphate cytidylyltransferase [Candidatus Atribacteria bacterium]|nr:2-C-methyl-D-erythritol 4-phosphate cytidylyltransferase [Candidatus Atribacteria bacterium]MCK4308746.1 2-C-methyl-D-erythritol 4-phosphate cytidylyltransferase [Candidatus Atribacteria bacterium]